MAYCTQSDIEARTGWGAGDFKTGGVPMTAEQWAAFCTDLIAEVTGLIDTYCRRTSFEVREYTEYHDGRGSTGDRREADRTFILREQPVAAVTAVEEDAGGPGSVPAWTLRAARSATAAGDYVVLARGPVTYLRFHNHVPAAGRENLRVTYSAGYAAGSDVLEDIRGICTDLIAEILAKKKQLQEAAAARTTGTRDAADMTPLDPVVLTTDIKRRLAPYRRGPRAGAAWR